MNIYGYCRISTAKQSIDRQIRNIRAEYPTAHIVQEAYTGTSIFRPEWLKLYRVLKSGDMVVFDSVSRMSRNAEEGFTLYEDLYHKGIRLVFLKEHHIDTETYKKALSGSIAMTGTNVDFILKGINEYLMALAKEQIKLAFEQSEKEVADLHQRTREGLLTARLNGKQVGRKKGIFLFVVLDSADDALFGALFRKKIPDAVNVALDRAGIHMVLLCGFLFVDELTGKKGLIKFQHAGGF